MERARRVRPRRRTDRRAVPGPRARQPRTRTRARSRRAIARPLRHAGRQVHHAPRGPERRARARAFAQLRWTRRAPVRPNGARGPTPRARTRAGECCRLGRRRRGAGAGCDPGPRWVGGCERRGAHERGGRGRERGRVDARFQWLGGQRERSEVRRRGLAGGSWDRARGGRGRGRREDPPTAVGHRSVAQACTDGRASRAASRNECGESRRKRKRFGRAKPPDAISRGACPRTSSSLLFDRPGVGNTCHRFAVPYVFRSG